MLIPTLTSAIEIDVMDKSFVFFELSQPKTLVLGCGRIDSEMTFVSSMIIGILGILAEDEFDPAQDRYHLFQTVHSQGQQYFRTLAQMVVP